MATFLLFGKYSNEAFKGLSASRTEKAVGLINKHSGKINSMYALLGERDLVFIIDFPSTEHAMKASIALCKLTNIAFTTSQAVPIGEFDNLLSEV